MKKVNMETNFNSMKEMAKQLGLKYVGVKKEVLVAQINEALESQDQSQKGGKWYEQEGAFPFAGGELVEIIDNKHKFLVGRRAYVTGPSAKKNAVKAYLISETSGGPQKTNITLDLDKIQLVTLQLPAIVPSRVIA